MFHDLEKSSTRSNAAVQTLFAHLQTCVAHLFVEEEEPEYQGGGKYLKAGDNWRDDYYTLMFMVTVELMTAYDQYESANSGGLTYHMYERFVDVLGRCRSWMNQTGVVLISKEDYARRTPVHPPVIRQEVGTQRDHESAALSTLQQEVQELNVKMTKLFEDKVDIHRYMSKQTTHNLQFSHRLLDSRPRATRTSNRTVRSTRGILQDVASLSSHNRATTLPGRRARKALAS